MQNSVFFLLFLTLCKYLHNRCREPKEVQHGEQRCRWGISAVNSCDGQERGAHQASFEERPVRARLNLNVSWYISITKQKKSRSETGGSKPADGSPSPRRSSLRTSRLQTGSDPGGSSRGFKMFLAICYSAIGARQPNLRLCVTQIRCESRKRVPGRTRDAFLPALQNTHRAFCLRSFQVFLSPASHWWFLKAAKGKKKQTQPPSDCCVCCGCRHPVSLL